MFIQYDSNTMFNINAIASVKYDAAALTVKVTFIGGEPTITVSDPNRALWNFIHNNITNDPLPIFK